MGTIEEAGGPFIARNRIRSEFGSGRTEDKVEELPTVVASATAEALFVMLYWTTSLLEHAAHFGACLDAVRLGRSSD